MALINKHIKPNNLEKQEKYLNIFWAGFIIYTLSNIFSTTGKFDYVVLQGIQSLGLLIIIFPLKNLIRLQFTNKYLRIVYMCYLCWTWLVVIRGFSFDYVFIKFMLFDAKFGMLPYFAPLILLFHKNQLFYKKLFDVIIILSAFYIVYDILFISELLNSDRESYLSTSIVEHSTQLSISAGFILLTYRYHSFKINIFSILVILATLYFVVFRARRGLVFIYLTISCFSYIIYLLYSNKKYLVVISSILILFIGFDTVKANLQNRHYGALSFLLERGIEDTRTGVEKSFYADMKTADWIVGKSINGKYFSPGIEENQMTNYRYAIETGYLQIILRGGIISLILILMIAVPAIFLSFFYARNLLSKAAGIWILLWLFYLYPATMESFSLYYLIFWISIGICYSKYTRNLPEKSVLNKYQNL